MELRQLTTKKLADFALANPDSSRYGLKPGAKFQVWEGINMSWLPTKQIYREKQFVVK